MSTPRLREHLLFPTRVMTLEYPDESEFHAALIRELEGLPGLPQGDALVAGDSYNLLDWAATSPSIARLRDRFTEGVRAWLRAEGLSGAYDADVQLFTNFAQPGEFTPAHNHGAHLAGVYYLRTGDYEGRDVLLYEPGQSYWRQDYGALILHDPRFNASLVSLERLSSARVIPRPGLLVIFPGYLWHSVTPNRGDFRRLAISANFQLTPVEDAGFLHRMRVSADPEGG